MSKVFCTELHDQHYLFTYSFIYLFRNSDSLHESMIQAGIELAVLVLQPQRVGDYCHYKPHVRKKYNQAYLRLSQQSWRDPAEEALPSTQEDQLSEATSSMQESMRSSRGCRTSPHHCLTSLFSGVSSRTGSALIQSNWEPCISQFTLRPSARAGGIIVVENQFRSD